MNESVVFRRGRFRQGTKLLRFRPDRHPRLCTMDRVATSGRAGL
jgi:hypothetical protein